MLVKRDKIDHFTKRTFFKPRCMYYQEDIKIKSLNVSEYALQKKNMKAR